MTQKSQATLDEFEMKKNIEISIAFNSLSNLFSNCMYCIRRSEEEGNQLVQNFDEQLKHLANTMEAPMLGVNLIFWEIMILIPTSEIQYSQNSDLYPLQQNRKSVQLYWYSIKENISKRSLKAQF